MSKNNIVYHYCSTDVFMKIVSGIEIYLHNNGIDCIVKQSKGTYR